ncbi:MAG: amidinotransferase [Prevotellaceae bacterium]|jgi:hypothetical protein|nr:amidinotransferase [Prevotellaceae bacterium]
MTKTQFTNTLLLVRPTNFGFNAQTAVNNSFQKKTKKRDVHQHALEEFDKLVETLNAAKVNTIVVNDEPQSQLPDSIFPNNWFSTHSDGSLCLYPMFAENRRQERKDSIINMLKENFDVKNVFDFTHYEQQNKFLEGTGSIVLDRINKIAYACLSPRTDETILDEFCAKLHYNKCCFRAMFAEKDIYHTNVMLSIADEYSILCTQSIGNNNELRDVLEYLFASGKEIVEINLEQMQHFAGNMLQISNSDGEKLLAMSSQAYESLNLEQIRQIERYNNILHSDLKIIERIGGGSLRCMLAEIFLEKKSNIKQDDN